MVENMVVTDWNQHRNTLIQYLLAKVEMNDWHGVSDAANDLRELEAAHPELKEQHDYHR